MTKTSRQIAESLIGTRVELHPSTDLWMRGARYGVIVGVTRHPSFFRVKLDKLAKPVRVHGDLLQPIGDHT